MDSRYNVVPSYRFILRIEGGQDVPLKSIRAFQKENEYDYIPEGGINDYVHILRKQVTKPFQLVVERYVWQNFYDPLPNGMKMFLPLILFVGGHDNQNFDFQPLRTYVFTGCIVMNKEVGQMDAERSGLLTETVTIGYSSLYTIDNPIDTSLEPWKFREGNISNKYADLGIKVSANDLPLGMSEDDEDSFMSRAAQRQWKFGDTARDYRGNGIRSARVLEPDDGDNRSTTEKWEQIASEHQWPSVETARHIPDNGSQESVEEIDARTWKFGTSAKDWQGNGVRYARSSEPDDGDPRSTTEKWTQIAADHQWPPKMSAREYPGEGTTETPAEIEARTWKFGPTAQETAGNGIRYARILEPEDGDSRSTTDKWTEIARKRRWPPTRNATVIPGKDNDVSITDFLGE